jgi:hypothetical protein
MHRVRQLSQNAEMAASWSEVREAGMGCLALLSMNSPKLKIL